MITREQLKNIPILNKQINSKIKQKEELWEMAMCVQSSNFTMERVQSSRHPDPMVLVDRLVDMEASINADIDDLVDLRTEAATLFKSLPERDCLLMELRYLEGLTWEKVAERMGKEVRQTFNIHARAINELFGKTED